MSGDKQLSTSDLPPLIPGCNPCLLIMVVIFGMAGLGICVISGLTLATVVHEATIVDPSIASTEPDVPLWAWVVIGALFGFIIAGAGAARR